MIAACGASTNDSSAPEMPAMKYSVMNRFDPNRCSTRGPKKNSTIMLKAMCMIPPCRNMYVTSVHGRTKIHAGTNANAFVTPGTVCWMKKTMMLAANSRLTHGVTAIPPH